jgi:PKD repeat protein
VTFTANATGSVPANASYQWNFGDGGGAFGQSVTHTYNTAGAYSVSLVVTGSDNAVVSNTATATITVGSGSQSAQSVTYQVGWNLASGPAGTTFAQADGPLYTYQAGDTSYETVANTTPAAAGHGYWAYFTAPTTMSLAGGSATLPMSITLPAGQYVMVGNPSTTQTVTVSGAEVVYTFNTASNSYSPASGTATLAPGQGAWVYSSAGGTVTLQ